VEEHASKLMRPGAHSNGAVEDGENILEWVNILQQFGSLKRICREQFCEQHRIMQRSILTLNQPLGLVNSAQLPNETSNEASSHPSSLSLVAQGSSLVVAPVSHSTASTSRKKNVCHLSEQNSTVEDDNN
jgi:hypothetical protein